MLHKFSILIVILFWALLSIAQVRFNKLIPNVVNASVSSILEISGGYLIVGGTFVDNNEALVLIKTDIGGNIIKRNYFFYEGGYFSGGRDNSCKKTNDGNYIISSVLIDTVYGRQQPYLMKFNIDLDSLWLKKYIIEGCWAQSHNVIETRDGGYAMSGGYMKYIDSTQTTYEEADVLLMKTDSLGNLLWWNHYGGSNTDGAYFIEETDDMGFVLAGTTLSFNGGLYPTDWYCVRTDSLGNYKYQHSYGHQAYDDGWIKGLTKLSDGNFLITGLYATYFNHNPVPYDYRSNAHLVKIRPNLTELWSKQYSEFIDFELPNDSSRADFYSCVELEDGGIVVLCRLENQNQRDRAKLYKLNSLGEKIWSRSYLLTMDDDYLGDYNATLQVLKQTSDNGFVLGGTAYISSPWNEGNYQQMWVVKVDEDGYATPTGLPEGITLAQYEVYPNPCNDVLYFENLEWPAREDCTLLLFDQLGREVHYRKISKYNEVTQIDVSVLPSGLYFLNVIHDDKRVFEKKIIIETR